MKLVFSGNLFFFTFCAALALGAFALSPAAPALAQPSEIVPCDGVDERCDFAALVRLAQNSMNWLVYAAVLAAAIAFTWAGFLYVTSAGNDSQITQAKGIFKNVAFGLVLTLAAWLIIYAVAVALLKEGFINLILQKPVP